MIVRSEQSRHDGLYRRLRLDSIGLKGINRGVRRTIWVVPWLMLIHLEYIRPLGERGDIASDGGLGL